MPQENYQNQKGFSLIEMLVAVFVIAFSMISMFGLNSKYSQETKQAKEAYEASLLAEEGVEIVKNIRDCNWIAGNDWDTGLTSCADGCEIDYRKYGTDGATTGLSAWATGSFLYINPSNKLYLYPTTAEMSTFTWTPYKRKIYITASSSNKLIISVIVSWYSYTTEVKQEIYNWR